MEQPPNNNEDLTRKIQKESFYKQQQQRLQNITLNKDLSADQLIKNILEKVDTDAKITKYYHTQHINNNNQKAQWNASTSSAVIEQQQQSPIHSNLQSPLPIPQCFLMNSEIPNIYLTIWNSVQNQNMTEFCQRDKLYQVLLSSQLSNDILAKLWSFVNRTKPGELTRNELFVMLALIGLIQQNVANPLNDLYTITIIPIPYFTLIPDIQNHELQSISKPEDDKCEENSSSQINDFENEFCEFKSADCTPSQEVANTICDLPSDTHDPKSIFPVEFTISPTENDDSSKNTCTEDLFTYIANKNNETLSNLSPEKESVTQEDLFEPSDKYSSFRNFELEDDFGDFHSQPIDQAATFENFSATANATKLNTENIDHFSIKQRILMAIKQLMHKTFNILTVNHDEESVIEALSSEKGTTFANDLYEVFQIALRIRQSLNDLTVSDNDNDSIQSIQSCTTIIDEILNNWNSISNILKKASINFPTIQTFDNDPKTSSTSTTGEQSQTCYICWTIDLNNNNNNKPTIWWSIYLYHTSCANFWLNYVDPNLPHDT